MNENNENTIKFKCIRNKMSSINNKGAIIDPGQCRCCGQMKKCRLLNLDYDFKGRKEIYAEIILDCFGIKLSHLDGKPEERLICATCVVRLRDANSFRRQALQCEEVLHKNRSDYYIKIEAGPVIKDKSEAEVLHSVQKDNDADNPATHFNSHLDYNACAKGEAPPLRSIKSREVNKIAKLKKQLSDSAAIKKTNNCIKEKREKISSLKEHWKRNKKGTQTTNISQRPKSAYDKSKRSQNAVTIVENSYVCPFDTVYNDYRCVYCSELFAHADSLREHTLKHDSSTYQDHVDNTSKYILIDLNRIDCRLCETSIDSVDTLKSHLNSEHDKNIYPFDRESTIITFKLENDKLSCTICDKMYDFIQPLKQHMAEHHGACICDACGSHFFDEVTLRKHKAQCHNPDAKNTIFECKVCHKTFKSKASERYHISRVHNKKPFYYCNKCDKTFSTYHFRLKHKIEDHGEVRVFPCNTCGKVFNMKMRLREHIRRSHLQILHHACTYCDMKFYIPSALKSHMVSHTGERNFRCEMCGKTYLRKSALRTHIGSHK